MTEKQSNGVLSWIKSHKIRSALCAGLLGLITTTALKDNVHFGSAKIYNPQENHYSWGLFPKLTFEGKNCQGNASAWGLAILSELEDDSSINGKMSSYGLFGGISRVGDNSTITGDMSSYGLVVGSSEVGDKSTITGDITSKGIFAVTPFGIAFGSNTEIGLENRLVEKKED